MSLKKIKPLPPIDYLSQLYELTEHGLLNRKRKGRGCRGAGSPAGHKKNTGKTKFYWYVQVPRFGYFLVHRIVYFMHSGVDPMTSLVDHIDGNTSNNMPSNLRLATPTQNLTNQNIPVRNTYTGIRSVHKNRNRFVVHLRISGKKRHLGSFKSIGDAAEFADLARAMAYGEFGGSA